MRLHCFATRLRNCARFGQSHAGFLLCLLVALGCQAQEVKPITPQCPGATEWGRNPGTAITHRYNVQVRTRSLNYSATAVMSWKTVAPQSYALAYDVGIFLGLGRKQRSEGVWSASGLSPRQFSEQGSRSQTLSVDAQRGMVKLPEAATEVPLIAGSQDKLSVWAQIGGWVACSPSAFENQVRLELPVWGSGDLEKWQIRSVGWSHLDTPYGPRKALQIVRPAGLGGDARIALWYVPEWGVLPVRLLIEQANGDVADQVLTERQPPP
jgi:hypothetical protein